LDQWAPDVQAVLTILGFWQRRVGGQAQWRDFHDGDYPGQISTTLVFQTASSTTPNFKTLS
jgi:hypothetical protein